MVKAKLSRPVFRSPVPALVTIKSGQAEVHSYLTLIIFLLTAVKPLEKKNNEL